MNTHSSFKKSLLLTCCLAVVGAGACSNPFNIKDTQSYQYGIRAVTSDEAVLEHTGWPAWPTGAVSLRRFEADGGTSEKAIFTTRVEGPDGAVRVQVRTMCILNECETEHHFEPMASESTHEAKTRHISGIELVSLDAGPIATRATVSVPSGVAFKLYPAGSDNAYTLYDAVSRKAYPLQSTEGMPTGTSTPGPARFTLVFGALDTHTRRVHLIEGEVGFDDTEYGVHFYNVPVVRE